MLADGAKQQAHVLFNDALGLALGRQASLDATTANLRAIEKLHSALELDPEHPLVRGVLGKVNQELGRHEEAAKWLRSQLEQRADDIACLVELALVEVRLNEHDAMREHLRRALDLDPDQETRQHLHHELTRLGDWCWDQAAEREAADPDLARGYRQFGVEMMSLAFEAQPSWKLSQKMAALCREMGEHKIAARFAEYGRGAALRDTLREWFQRVTGR